MAIAHIPLSAYERKKFNGRFVPTISEVVCIGCSKTFRPKRAAYNKFCSRDCAYEQQKKLGSLHTNFQKKIKEPKFPYSVVHFQNCQHCGVLFASKGKARWCKAHSYIAKPRLTRPCAGQCGNKIQGSAGKKWCQPCRRKRSRKNFKLKHGSVKSHRHKARLYGGAYEPVNPIEVFNRDGWHCQLCGHPTLRKMRGTHHDRAPELDHIVPLSCGGDHTYANTQCSHRECNIAKGATPKGQMRLDL